MARVGYSLAWRCLLCGRPAMSMTSSVMGTGFRVDVPPRPGRILLGSARYRSYGLEGFPKPKLVKPVKKWEKNPALEADFQQITSKALHGSIDEALIDFRNLSKKSVLPDWMAMKLSAMVAASADGWPKAKALLDAQYLATGGSERLARTASVDERQVVSCLERILRKESDDAFTVAKHFYRSLVDLKFTNVKDSAMRVFVQYYIDRKRIDQSIDEFINIASFGRVKSLNASVYIIMRAVHRSNSKTLADSVKTLLATYVKTDSQRLLLSGCVLLADGHPLEFAERIRIEKYPFGDADVNTLCEFAEKMREPEILDSLIGIPTLFNLSEKSRATIYTTLARTYAKLENAEGLQKSWKLLEREKELEQFAVVIAKFAHFFRCLNRVAPDSLHSAMKHIITK